MPIPFLNLTVPSLSFFNFDRAVNNHEVPWDQRVWPDQRPPVQCRCWRYQDLWEARSILLSVLPLFILDSTLWKSHSIFFLFWIWQARQQARTRSCTRHWSPSMLRRWSQRCQTCQVRPRLALWRSRQAGRHSTTSLQHSTQVSQTMTLGLFFLSFHFFSFFRSFFVLSFHCSSHWGLELMAFFVCVSLE